MNNDVLTTNEVVKYFRITKGTLFKMVREGKIRAFRVGNAYRFKRTEIDEDLRVSKPDEPKAVAR